MDPKEKDGTKWSKKPPVEQLEILRRYRDKCFERGGVAAETAQDNFVENVLSYNLVQTHFEEISNNNRV